MPFGQFLSLDLVGSSLWILAYGGAGFLFHDFMVALTHGFQAAGNVVGIVIAVAIAAYFIHRMQQYRKLRIYRIVPRVKWTSWRAGFIPKVRTKSLWPMFAVMVTTTPAPHASSGSIRIEPNNLEEEIKRLAHDKDIYLYCT